MRVAHRAQTQDKVAQSKLVTKLLSLAASLLAPRLVPAPSSPIPSLQVRRGRGRRALQGRAQHSAWLRRLARPSRCACVIPEGVIGVKPMPKPGWTLETVRGAYARTYPFYHGADAERRRQGGDLDAASCPTTSIDEFVFAGFLADSLPAGQHALLPDLPGMREGLADMGRHARARAGRARAELARARRQVLLPAADKTVGPRPTRSARWSSRRPGRGRRRAARRWRAPT